MDVRVEPQRRLNAEELVLWTVALEKILESPLYCKKVKPVNPKGNQFWVFIGRIDTEAESLIFWPPNMKNWLTGKDFDTGKNEGRKRIQQRQGGWMASLTKSTWVWASSKRWWRTGKPGVLQSMGLKRVGHDWVTDQFIRKWGRLI